ncbi:MAG TPA: hypothetical protein VMU74_02180 [Gaiellaceae bacterium]|nr:hypothetical protein [Gaiellaceae bacterium]
MRTTVTLDPDVEAQVKRLMAERGLSFKEAVNTAIRAGLRPPGEPFRTPTYDMGEPFVDLTKALRLAGELEDDEIVRRLAARK